MHNHKYTSLQSRKRSSNIQSTKMQSQTVILFLLFTAIQAFTIQPAVTPTRVRSVNLFMANDAQAEAEALREKARLLKEEVAALSGTTVEKMDAKAVEEKAAAPAPPSTGENLYDDQVAEFKDPLSDNMRAKLMREASSGLDSEKPQTNVILYISVVVAILVGLAGSGILY